MTLLLALRRLGGNGATLVALIATSVLLGMSGSLLAAGANEIPPQRYAGAPIVVGGNSSAVVHRSGKDKTVDLPGPRPVPPEVVDTIRRHVPADARVITDVTARVAVGFAGNWTPVVAHGWSATQLGPSRLVTGTTPAGPDQVVVDDSFGWAPGTVVQVLTDAGPQARTVVGRVAFPGGAPAVYLSDDAVATLAERPAIAAVGIIADPTKVADDLRTALADANVVVRTGDGRGRIEFPDIAHAQNDLSTLSGSLVAIVVMVALVIVGSTYALAMARRRRAIATLRALGATPRQLERLATVEMAGVGLVAGLLGLVPAAVLTTAFDWLMRTVGLLPADLHLTLGVLPSVAAVVLTTVIAAVTGWAAGRRTAAVSPTTALATAENQDQPTPRWQAVLGGVLVVLGVAAALLPLLVDGIVGVAVAGGGGLLLVAGTALLTRPLVGLLFRLVARRLLASRVPHRWLAGAGMSGQTTRLAAAVAPMLLMVGICLVQVLLPASFAAAAQQQAAAGLRVPQAVIAPGYGLPSRELGVAVARQQVIGVTTVLDGPETFKYTATGLRGPVSPTLDLALRPGSTWNPTTSLGPDQAVIGASTAATLGAHVGDRAELVLADGTTVTPTVVGVSDRGIGLGDVLLDYATLTSHRPTTGPAGQAADLLLLPTPSDRLPYGLAVSAADAFGAGRGATSSGIAASTIPLIALFGYIAVAVTNSLVLSVTSRTTTFRMLRRTGADRKQLARSLVVEGITVVVAAVGLGTAAALPPMVTVATRLTASPWPTVPLWFYLAVITTVSVLAMAAVILPGRLVLKRDLR
ncbi:FtsX-like permease family protein [Actinocrispum wychmicini]|uniref:Putative ABC transport system permease protein n=1 Tax=Actinocrispum wychmicini TaxID=1213861 RepID=A0A4R2ILV9_9PSEU|nr:FtsX-like permease family protein [Actinocrispum wychmicini]TCO45326.1 putative ABC transport system permease protein [Actinocrispum wychmicini]